MLSVVVWREVGWFLLLLFDRRSIMSIRSVLVSLDMFVTPCLLGSWFYCLFYNIVATPRPDEGI